ncbi:ETS homologous factor [Eumeta japonica]|uniref:ETS homologous factor n=1 Tax=Eumeta variegata TaxID=151549 RepID=A0A4C1Z751_EUMVA|nr:ETS homologous factor [Eumeta japonica]
MHITTQGGHSGSLAHLDALIRHEPRGLVRHTIRIQICLTHLRRWQRFVKPDEVAKLWGSKKQNDKMSFEKFSRAMRYHYRQHVLVSVPTARLVYQFGPKGPEYRTDNPNFTKVKTELDAIKESSFS